MKTKEKERITKDPLEVSIEQDISCSHCRGMGKTMKADRRMFEEGTKRLLAEKGDILTVEAEYGDTLYVSCSKRNNPREGYIWSLGNRSGYVHRGE